MKKLLLLLQSKIRHEMRDKDMGMIPPKYFYYAYNLHHIGRAISVYYIFPLNKIMTVYRNFTFWMHNKWDDDLRNKIYQEGYEAGSNSGYNRGKVLSDKYIEMYKDIGVK